MPTDKSPPRCATHVAAPPRTTPSRSRALGAIIMMTAALIASATVAAKAPYVKAGKPITDQQGRVQVIIDFADDAHMQYPGKLPTLPAKGESRDKLVDFFHTEKTLALVADFERRYTFSRTGMTSWIANSVTAYLDATQIEKLLADPLVKQVSDNYFAQFSSPPPPWGNSSSGDEWTSWGHEAVNGKSVTANSGRKIYMIDSGVAWHDDLPPITRLNVVCGASGNCNAINPLAYQLVGCYGHATHVAGIISAISGNDKTMRGAYAGFPNLVSLAVAQNPGNTPNCADATSPDIDAISNALDYVAWDATYNNPNRLVHIVTMSINDGGTAYINNDSPPVNWNRIKSISTTIWAYGIPIQPGVVV